MLVVIHLIRNAVRICVYLYLTLNSTVSNVTPSINFDSISSCQSTWKWWSDGTVSYCAMARIWFTLGRRR